MRMRQLTPYLLLVGGGVVGVAVTLHAQKHQQDQIADLDRRVAEVASAAQRPSPVAPGLPIMPWNGNVGATTVAPPQVATATTAQSADAGSGGREPPLSEAEIQTNLEASFASERRTGNWGGMSEGEAERKLQALLPPGSDVQSFDCHETMCRIETNHRDRPQYQQYVNAALFNPQTKLWNGGFVVNPTFKDDGTVVAIAFMAQDGKNLPYQ